MNLQRKPVRLTANGLFVLLEIFVLGKTSMDYQELEERELKTACLCPCGVKLICLHALRETHEVSLCEDCAGE